ncbi:MAG: glycosyltransferase family 39 protein [Planctomycetia bacterium]|nr:MAG: glycosyltransferase family 39 protein [Planctomycetia bacterium]
MKIPQSDSPHPDPGSRARYGRSLHLAFWLILVGAAVVRCAGLGSLPPPLNQDEASRGYDAWALLETGADRHGAAWPFFLRSFGPGDYTAALSTYLTMPFVAILGPTPTAIRLPTAILSVCTVAMLFALVRRRLGDGPALVAASILALDPWHVGLSRTAHEAGFAPFFLILALLGLDRAGLWPADTESSAKPINPSASRREQWVAAAFAGLGLACHAWVYPATRLFTPLFLAAYAILYRRPLKRMLDSPSQRVIVMAGFAGLIAGTTPLCMTAITHPEQLAARAQTVLLDPAAGRWPMLRNFTLNFASDFSPRSLFWHSDDVTGVSLPGVGRHLPITAPLALAGLLGIVAQLRRDCTARLLFAWLLLYPVPAAICGDWNPHPLRSVGGVLLYPVMCAMGVAVFTRRRVPFTADRLARRRRAAWRTIAALALTVNGADAARRYVRALTGDGAVGYQAALHRAMAFVARHGQDADFVLVTNRCVQPYIYALWVEPIAPNALRGMDFAAVPGVKGFDNVVRVGRYYFVPKDPRDAAEAAALFRKHWDKVPRTAIGLIIARCDEAGTGTLLATFQTGSPDQGDCFGIWRASRSAITD